MNLSKEKLQTLVYNLNELCLDLDEEVYPIVKDIMPDLIITHHPFIYGTKYKVFKYDEKKKALCEAIDKLNIPVYSMHTNFDEGRGGMNEQRN